MYQRRKEVKIFIKDVENGWLVHYDVMNEGGGDYEKVGEKEKVFTYDFNEEKENAWRRLEWFVALKFIDSELHKKIYLQTFDEEKGEWVGSQEFHRREYEAYRKRHTWGPPTPATKEDKKIFKKWEEERIANMTLNDWELGCAKITFDNLRKHFNTPPNNTCMTQDEYEEIRSTSEKQCTKENGSRP